MSASKARAAAAAAAADGAAPTKRAAATATRTTLRKRRKRTTAGEYKEPVSCGVVRRSAPSGAAAGGSGANKLSATSEGPFPKFLRPTPGDAYRAVDELTQCA